MTIPEIATQQINKMLTNTNEDDSRTVFFVGSKNVGKSTLIYSFLDKTDTARETLVLEYSFGRKTNQKQGIEKTVCHVWEYGGKLDILKNALSSVPVRGLFYYCIMLDTSKIKSMWNTLETCLQAMSEIKTSTEDSPEILIIAGKYDLFKNYDSDVKKFICMTLRSVALHCRAHLISYSSKEQHLVRRTKEIFHSMGFGASIAFKEKNTNWSKPLVIPKGSDSWENLGIDTSNLDQIKVRHLSRFPAEADSSVVDQSATSLQRSYPEPTLDSLVSLKYDELRNLESLDISLDDYLLSFR